MVSYVSNIFNSKNRNSLLIIQLIGLTLVFFGVIAFRDQVNLIGVTVTAMGSLVIFMGAFMQVWVSLRGSAKPKPVYSIYELKKKISTLEDDLNHLKERQPITEQERARVVESAILNLQGSAIDSAFSEWKKRNENTTTEFDCVNSIRNISTLMQNRLEEEIVSLGDRAKVNLSVGSAITAVGVVALGLSIYWTLGDIQGNLNYFDISVKFIMRFSLVVFLEVFAYFFLRLYRYAIYEIKYFQNEITSAQFRIMSLEAALKIGDKDVLKNICIEMSKVERNFILKKGEMTVALKAAELELGSDRKLMEFLEKFMKLNKNG